MLWKRHLSLYSNNDKNYSQPRKQNNRHTNLAPLQSVGKITNNNTIETNQTKFMIRKKSKSNKISKQPLFNSFFLHKGNNHLLVKKIFQEYGLIEVFNKQAASLIWYQGKQPARRDLQNKQLSPKLNNYLPNHSQITNKQKLYENISRYYPESVNSFLPKSYIIDFRENLAIVQNNLVQFLSDYFIKNKIAKPPKKNNSFYIINYHGQICILYSRVFKKMNEMKKQEEVRKQSKLNKRQNQNLWIVKPAFLNRGQGIQVMSTLKHLEKILSEDNQQISIKMYQGDQKQGPSSYIIQQYISNPLLFEGYKFDMRVWVLLRKNRKKQIEVYIYKRGYVRLATHKYTISQSNLEENHDIFKQQQTESPSKIKKVNKNQINNRFIHLTNNAVQKNCKDYGSLYEGNQLSIKQMIQALNIPQLTQEYLYDKFIQIIKIMLNSCWDKIFAKTNSNSFMLIGMDYLLDKDHNVWLIEANCNPCLQQSSNMLKIWLPQMLREMLQIVKIDKLGKINIQKSVIPKTSSNSKLQTIGSIPKQAESLQEQTRSAQIIQKQVRQQNERLVANKKGYWQKII